MPTPIDQLHAQLSTLNSAIPQLLAEHPEPAEFWPAFAGMADVIEDGAGKLADYASEQIQAMLVAHGIEPVR